MTLPPYLWDGDDSYLLRPSRLLGQHFGLALEPDDFHQPFTALTRLPAGYLRNWKSLASAHDSGSTVTFDKEKFHANLDVQQFKPEEISVKITGDNIITIDGKHEEKEDEHGQIYRHFVRRYVVPDNCDLSKVESKLSSDGILSITAPRVHEKQIEHKIVPIAHTGKPSKAVEKKEQKGEAKKKTPKKK